jgi:tetratricopeptide (TPR) repeat protein
MGWCHATLGDHRRAHDRCLRALALAVEVGDPGIQGGVWDTIGFTYAGRGYHQWAVACYERALALHRDAGDRYIEAETLTRLGDSRRAIGELDRAQDAWRQALDILTTLRHPDAGNVRRRLSA